MRDVRRLVIALSSLGLAFGLAACGDTWSGMKQDTKDNVEATGEGIEKTGEKIKESTQ